MLSLSKHLTLNAIVVCQSLLLYSNYLNVLMEVKQNNAMLTVAMGGGALYAAHGGEARAELHRELVGEVAPVVVSDLRLEPVEDLREHLLQVVLGVRPGGHGVAEEHEVGHHPAGVDLYHLADAAKGGVLLVVVADVAQRRAPEGDTLSFLTLVRSWFCYRGRL